MIKLYHCCISFPDLIFNISIAANSKENAISQAMSCDGVASKLSQGFLIRSISCKVIENASQSTEYDFRTFGLSPDDVLGVYFNFQKGYIEPLASELEALIKKYFNRTISIKRRTSSDD